MVLAPKKLSLLGGPAVRPDICPQPTGGSAVRLVCVLIFFFPQAAVTFGVMLVPVGAACTLPGLWHCFGWVLAKVILEGVCCQENVWAGHAVSTLSVHC